MRFLYVIASAVALAGLAYLYTADLTHDAGSDKREKPSLDSTAVTTAPRPSAMPRVAQRGDSGNETRPERGDSAATRKVALRRKPAPMIKADANLPESPFTREIASERAAFKPKVKAPEVQPSARQNPKDGRWVRELSGSGARLSMGKQATAGSCYTYGCEREPAPKDLNLAGVVVRNERLVDRKDGLMTGSVKRGHYLDHTPAVFIE